MGRKKHLLATASLMLMWLGAAGAAVADDASSQQIPTARTTQIVVSSGIRYDSNSARLSRDLATLEGQRLADETSSSNASIVVARPVGVTMVFLRGDGGYDVNRVNSIRDHFHLSLFGGVQERLGQCQGSGTGTYGQTQSDYADLFQLDPNGGITRALVRNTETRENISVSAKCGRPIGLTPSITVTQSWFGNSELLRKSINNEVLAVSGGLGYQKPIFGLISMFGEYDDISYPNQPILLSNGIIAPFGYSVIAGGVRYERLVGSRIDAVASVSYTSLTPNGQRSSSGSSGATSTGPNFSGLTYSLDLSYRLSKRTTVHVNTGRATNPSNRLDANFSVDETYRADVTYRMGPKLTLGLAVSDTTHGYHGLPASSAAVSYYLDHETTTQVFGSATYRVNRRLWVTLTLGDAERRATPAAYNFSSTTAGLTAKATF